MAEGGGRGGALRGVAKAARRAGSGLAGAAAAMRGQVMAIADDIAERRRASDQRLTGGDDRVDVQVPMAHVRGGRMYASVSRDTRRQMWLGLLHSQRDKGYSHLRDKLPEESVRQLIERDVPRTFPTHPLFRGERGPGRAPLYRVLCAYSVYDSGVAYCQGMNFVGGMLLMYLEHESEVFDALCSLMFAAGLREYYLPDMDMLQLRMFQLERLLRERCPRLAAHLADFGIGPVLYASGWFLTLFSTEYPLRFASRVLDIVLAERSMLVVMQLGLQLLEETEAHALRMDDFEEIVVHIRSWLPSLPLDDLHEILTAALLADLTQAKLDELEKEYRAEREAGKAERDATRARRKQELAEEQAARSARIRAEDSAAGVEGAQAYSAVVPAHAREHAQHHHERGGQERQQHRQNPLNSGGAPLQYGSAAADDMLAKFLTADTAFTSADLADRAPNARSRNGASDAGGRQQAGRGTELLRGKTPHSRGVQQHGQPAPVDRYPDVQHQQPARSEWQQQQQRGMAQRARHYPPLATAVLANGAPMPPLSSEAAMAVSNANGLDPLGRLVGDMSVMDRSVIDDYVCVGVDDVASAEEAAAVGARKRAHARGGVGGGLSSLMAGWHAESAGGSGGGGTGGGSVRGTSRMGSSQLGSGSVFGTSGLRQQQERQALSRGKMHGEARSELFKGIGGGAGGRGGPRDARPPGSKGGPPSLL